MTDLPHSTPCPCGLPLRYSHCCARFHSGDAAPDPEALMRSRYSAYVLNLTDYLQTTWHPSTRPSWLPPSEEGLKWLGLEVKSAVQTDATHGMVSFVARSKLAGRATRLCETSRFVLEDGRWFYVDGELG
jgi:SEC-C motif domain protein